VRRLLIVPALAAALCGCPPDESPSTGGHGGTGGVTCPSGPVALLDVTIRATTGTVPADTTLAVSWSAGDEQPFSLDDPKTWSTLADGNVVCDVDKSKPPPTDLAALVCHLWTSGPTKVAVSASGYVTWSGTLTPAYSAVCKEPVPTSVTITLAPLPDAGAM
jgi:hypothetical protein